MKTITLIITIKDEHKETLASIALKALKAIHDLDDVIEVERNYSE